MDLGRHFCLGQVFIFLSVSLKIEIKNDVNFVIIGFRLGPVSALKILIIIKITEFY